MIAAAHGGDNDSTAAIAGNMLGLLDPAAVLRHLWAEIVEDVDIISQLVQDYREVLADIDAAEKLIEVYPGG